MQITKYINQIAYRVVGCAIEVHKHLGPGLLESVYETCLIDELISSGLRTAKHIAVPILYKGKELGCNLVLDLLVEDLVIVELKAVETMIPVYRVQLLSYLKLTDKPKGLLINFNCVNIKDQLVPFVTDQFMRLPKG